MEEARNTTLTKTRIPWLVLVLGVAVATLTLAIPGVASAQAPSANPPPACPPGGCIYLTYGCTNGAIAIQGSQICHDSSGYRLWTTGDFKILATPDSGYTFQDWSGSCVTLNWVHPSNQASAWLNMTGSCQLFANVH